MSKYECQEWVELELVWRYDIALKIRNADGLAL